MVRVFRQVLHLALAEIQRNYLSTRLGFLWAFIQPAATFALFWIVSVYGLKMGPGATGVPYFAVLFCGLLPWMTISGAISSASGSLRGQKYLLVDRAASATTLVLSNVAAAAIMHLPLFAIVAAIFLVAGIPFTLSWIAVIYYYVCLLTLTLVSCLIVAPLSARSPDFTQVVTTLLLFWFWASPIIWAVSALSGKVLAYFMLNPLFYVVEGYRGALLYDHALAPSPGGALMFWGTVAVALVAGIQLLRVSEPHLREWILR